MLLDLIKKHFNCDDATAQAFAEAMKTNKIYTTSEENADIRLNKAKEQIDAFKQREATNLELIEQLKGGNNVEEMQTKITEYETKIATLESELTEKEIKHEIESQLIANGADAKTVDFLMFKVNQDNELKLDKEGKVKGLDSIIETTKKNYSNYFNDKAKKEVDVKDLQEDDNESVAMTKADFLSKPYGERNRIATENPELFKQLFNEE